MRRVLGAIAIVFLFASVAHAQPFKLAWDSSSDTSVVGYKIYLGNQSGVYGAPVDVGNTTVWSPPSTLDLSRPWFFAVSSYNADGLESTRAAEVNWQPVNFTSLALSSTAVTIGTPVIWSASATSTTPVEYQFWLSGRNGWSRVQDYSASGRFTWIPTWDDQGEHNLQVWARPQGSTASYTSWVASSTVHVATIPLNFTTSVAFPTPPGNTVTLTAVAPGAGATQLEYKFWVRNDATGSWTIVRDYGALNSASWTPAKSGSYTLQAWARRVGSTADEDVFASISGATVKATPLTITALTSDAPSPTDTGTTVTWTATAKGGSAAPLEYEFWRYRRSTGWTIVQPYSTSPSWTWTPTYGDEGAYNLQVWARGAAATDVEAWKGADFTVQTAPVQLSTDAVFPIAQGTSVSWKASTSAGSTPVDYEFWVQDRATGAWTMAQPYSANSTFTWQPAVGSYQVQVWARRSSSTADHDAWKGTDPLAVVSTPPMIQSLTADQALPMQAGTTITWSARATGGTQGPLEYKFWLQSSAGWTVLQNWSTAGSVSWTPLASDTGAHVVQVWVRSAGASDWEAWKASPTFVIQP